MKEAWKDQPITLVRRNAIKINGDDIPDAYHAVFLKHREILTTAKKLGEKHILIMEDDAVPCKDFAKHWTVIKEYLDARDDWELFNGGMLMMRDCIDKIVRIDHTDMKDLYDGAGDVAWCNGSLFVYEGRSLLEEDGGLGSRWKANV
jgi:hypothetical protein